MKLKSLIIVMLVGLVGLYSAGVIKLPSRAVQKSCQSSGFDYQIIYMNGPSSVGKSTLARALQDRLPEPFLLVGIDSVIAMMPEKYNDWHNDTQPQGFGWEPVKDDQQHIIAYKIHIGSYGQQMIDSLKDIVVTLARSGHHIIVDDVSFGNNVTLWRQALKDFKVLWIGVTAPLDVIEQREQSRGDRKLGSARWQAERVHIGNTYDLMIDTHARTTEEAVDQIVKFCAGT